MTKAVTLALAIVLSALCGLAWPQSAYIPPEQDPAFKARLASLRAELETGGPSDAAGLLDGLLAEASARPLLVAPTTDDTAAMSLNLWLDALPRASRDPLLREHDRASSAAAASAIRVAELRTPADLAALHRLTWRYPASHVGRALHRAALTAAARGDVESALTLASDAASAGESGAGALLARLTPLAPGTDPQGFVGAVPFHADWYRERRPAAARRLYPQAAGGLTFVASPSHVVALSEQATVQWVWRIDDLDPSLDREAVARLSRLVSSASLRPAVVVGRQGEAALVIARMMAATRDGPAAGTAVLRALRATDGVLIWTASLSRSPAEGKAEGGQVQTAAIASSPAVKGSFVYAAAVRSSGSSDELLLVAFDLTDGSLIWETRLGGYTPALAGGRASAGLMWRTLPTPVVDDRAVYLATDAGAVIAVDRFGGAIRWIARYPTIADPDRFDGTPALVSSSQPGGVDATLVVAPRDSADLFVFAARDGRRLARSGQYSGLTLIGVESGSSPLALLAGREVAGVEVPSMKQRWRWAATGETTIHGVSAKAGAQVYVPTSVGFAALSTETGELIRGVSPAAANLRRLTRSEVGQGLLSSLNMVGAFEDDGSPRVSGDRPPQRVPQAPPLNQRPRDGRVPAQRANE